MVELNNGREINCINTPLLPECLQTMTFENNYNFVAPRTSSSDNTATISQAQIEAEQEGDVHERNSQVSASSATNSFRFGQFGQAPLPSDWSISAEQETTTPSPLETPTAAAAVAEAIEKNESFVDTESFLAEPSISIGQFDDSFTVNKSEIPDKYSFFDSHIDTEASRSVTLNNNDNINDNNNNDDDYDLESKSRTDNTFIKEDIETSPPAAAPISSTSSIKSSSIPELIEEPFEQSIYLEEPSQHSVEELQIAKFENEDESKESWENVQIAEIEAAEKEFGGLQQKTSESKDESEQNESEAQESKFENFENSKNDDYLKEKVINETVDFENKSLNQEKSSDQEKSLNQEKTLNHEKTLEQEKTLEKVKVASSVKRKEKASNNAVSPQKKTKVQAQVPIVQDRPVRERKSVQRLSEISTNETKKVSEKSKTLTIPKGSGLRLGDIEIINQALNKRLASDKTMILLHRIIYDRMGEARLRKSNLRAFCGPENDANFDAKLQKYTNAELKELASLLRLSGANDKAALVTKISTFLSKPSAISKVAKPDTLKKTKSTGVTKAKAKTATRKRKSVAAGKTNKGSVLTPEIVDSDVESDVEREVLDELIKKKID